jgi:DNA-binding HxlR family transcriptional regulator
MVKQSRQVRGSETGRPIMRLLDVLGRRWSLRILWELRDRRLTFRELRESCDDVSPTSLNRRLKELRDLQLVDHDETGFGYTRFGSELGEQLLVMNRWSEGWASNIEVCEGMK